MKEIKLSIIYSCGIEVLATPQQDEYRNDAKEMKLSSDTKLTYIHAPLCNNEQFSDKKINKNINKFSVIYLNILKINKALLYFYTS